MTITFFAGTETGSTGTPAALSDNPSLDDATKAASTVATKLVVDSVTTAQTEIDALEVEIVGGHFVWKAGNTHNVVSATIAGINSEPDRVWIFNAKTGVPSVDVDPDTSTTGAATWTIGGNRATLQYHAGTRARGFFKTGQRLEMPDGGQYKVKIDAPDDDPAGVTDANYTYLGTWMKVSGATVDLPTTAATGTDATHIDLITAKVNEMLAAARAAGQKAT